MPLVTFFSVLERPGKTVRTIPLVRRGLRKGGVINIKPFRCLNWQWYIHSETRIISNFLVIWFSFKHKKKTNKQTYIQKTNKQKTNRQKTSKQTNKIKTRQNKTKQKNTKNKKQKQKQKTKPNQTKQNKTKNKQTNKNKTSEDFIKWQREKCRWTQAIVWVFFFFFFF